MADGKVQVDITADASRYLAALGTLESSTRATMATVSSVASTVGKGLTVALTAPLLAFASYAVKSAVEFESAFAGVRKTVDATEDAYSKLADAAREMSEVKPVSASDIATIMEYGGQLGVATGELSKFAGVVSDLSVATNMTDYEQASTQLAQFMNVMEGSADDIDRVGATLVALGNSSATTEQDIMNMASRLDGAGKTMGLTSDEVLSLSAAMSSVGINAEAGGSALSQVMTQIQRDVSLGTDNLQLWAQLAGTTSQGFAEAWANEPVDALMAVISGMASASDSSGELTVKLDELGIDGIRQTDMLNKLASASGLVSSTVALGSQAWSDNTALVNEATQRYSTTESQLQILKDKFENVASTVGGPLLACLNDLVDAAGPLLTSLRDQAQAFADLDSDQQKAIVSTVAAAAALGPLLVATAKVRDSVTKTKAAYSAFTAAQKAKAAADKAEAIAAVSKMTSTNADTTATNKNSTVLLKNIAAQKAAAQAAMTNLASYAAGTAGKEADTVATGANAVAEDVSTASTGANTGAKAANAVATTTMTVAQKAAAVATALLNAALDANPLVLIALAVAGVVTVLGTLVTAESQATDGSDELTESSERQKEKLDGLQSKYDELCETQGAESDAALAAKAALDEERSSFESSRQTLAQFHDSCAQAVQDHQDLTASAEDSIDTADDEAGKLLYLSQQLESLTSTTRLTKEEKARLKAVVDGLNESLEDANLVYDEETGLVTGNVEAVKKLAKAEADRLRSSAKYDAYLDELQSNADLNDKLAQSYKELNAKVEKWGEENGKSADEVDAAKDAVKRYVEGSEEFDDVIAVTNAGLGHLINDDGGIKDLQEEYDASCDSVSGYEDELGNLIEQEQDAAAQEQAVSDAVAFCGGDMDLAAEAAARYKVSVDDVSDALQAQADEALQAEQDALKEITDSINTYIEEDNPGFAKALSDSGLSVEGFARVLDGAGVSFDDFSTNFENVRDRVCDAFNAIDMQNDFTFDKLLENLQTNLDATASWSGNLEYLYANAGDQATTDFLNYIAAAGPEYAVLVQQFADDPGALAACVAKWQETGSGIDAAQIGIEQSTADANARVSAESAAMAANVAASSEQMSSSTSQLASGTAADAAATASSMNALDSSMAGSCSSMSASAAEGTADVEAAFDAMPSGISGSVPGVVDQTGRVTDAIDGIQNHTQYATFYDSANSGIGGGLADGMMDAVGWVTQGAWSIANAISSVLHFSVPEEGPLHTIGSWMPDMVQGLTDDMRRAAPALAAQARDTARGISDAFAIDSLVNLDASLSRSDVGTTGAGPSGASAGATVVYNSYTIGSIDVSDDADAVAAIDSLAGIVREWRAS